VSDIGFRRVGGEKRKHRVRKKQKLTERLKRGPNIKIVSAIWMDIYRPGKQPEKRNHHIWCVLPTQLKKEQSCLAVASRCLHPEKKNLCSDASNLCGKKGGKKGKETLQTDRSAALSEKGGRSSISFAVTGAYSLDLRGKRGLMTHPCSCRQEGKEGKDAKRTRKQPYNLTRRGGEGYP